MGPRGTNHYIWQLVLLKKCQQAQIPCISPFSSQKTYDIVILPEVNRTHKKLGILLQLSSGPLGTLFRTKFTFFFFWIQFT